MKGLLAGTTSQEDVLLLLCLHRWRKVRDADIESQIVAAAERIGYFPNHTDGNLSDALMKVMPELKDEFAAFAESDPFCQEVLSHLGAYRRRTGWSLQDHFVRLMAGEPGAILKLTPWWAANVERMRDERADLKKVKKVMES